MAFTICPDSACAPLISVFRVFQAAQMQELLTILSYETKPIVLVGDFNSSPDDVPGNGFDEYVSDPTAELTSRIDIVFLDPKNLEIDKVQADVVGDKVEDMTPSGFWPSDHAGVVAKIKFNK